MRLHEQKIRTDCALPPHGCETFKGLRSALFMCQQRIFSVDISATGIELNRATVRCQRLVNPPGIAQAIAKRDPNFDPVWRNFDRLLKGDEAFVTPADSDQSPPVV